MNILRESAIFVFFALAAVEAVTSTPPDDYVVGEKELDFNSQVLLKAIKKGEDQLMDHIELLQSQIKYFEQKYTIEENKILKNKIYSLENEKNKLNESMTEENKIFKNFIIFLENEKKQLNESFQELINIPCEQIDRDGTHNIWEALLRRSLAGVKYWYILKPASIHSNNENDFKWTPLFWASSKGQLEIVQFLLSKGVDVDPMTSSNTTALMYASHNGHVSVVKALLDKGANINHQDKYKQTPLEYAVLGNQLSVVKVLIERGADQSLRNFENNTSLDFARELGDRESIIEYLTSH